MEPLIFLVVDDDDSMRAALARMVARDPRARAIEAADGLEALRILEQQPIDVVISDEVMPNIKGVRLLETIRARWPGTRRVLYTGFPNADVVMDAVNRGGVDKALYKGIMAEQLRAELTELIDDCVAKRVDHRGDPPVVARVERRGNASSVVLVICDELAIRGAMSTVLGEAGFVPHGTDVASFAAALGAHSPNVIVLDLSIPMIEIGSVMQQIREVDLDCPVIVTAPRDALERAHEAIRYGAHRYLVHPVARDALVSVVEKAGRLHELSRLRREAVAETGGGIWGMGDRASLEARFARALEKLFMVYQPIVSLSRREIIGYEALVRSEDSILSNPGALFDVAHRLDAVDDLGRAIRAIATTPFGDRDDDCLLFLNLHVNDVRCQDLLGSPLASMAERIVLEITERAALESVEGIGSSVAALRALGYRIAVDDLGAGYAGLSSFVVLEPEIIKLDMSLVRDVDQFPTKQRLVAGLQETCRDLGVLMVSEGVETIQERDALSAAGCDIFQGYLFARPARPFPEVRFG
jgi:EAL domain-containing protein (putative c-di-GMP-specific phosphodiesterase class I)